MHIVNIFCSFIKLKFEQLVNYNTILTSLAGLKHAILIAWSSVPKKNSGLISP